MLCLVVSEGEQRSVFAPINVYKTRCNIQQLSVQRTIVNVGYFLPFKMASSGYQTLDHARLPISGIRKSLSYSFVNC